MYNKVKPFLEKYRPKCFNEIVGQKHIIDSLKEMKKSILDFPHLMFYGPPGIGKTTTAQALAYEIYGPDWDSVVCEINASEERNLDTVRNKIITYCKTMLPVHDVERKMVILEEADHFNVQSQPALRRPMEQYSENTIFVLTCNNPKKIITPIQSRCAVFKFEDPTEDDIGVYIGRVAAAETVVLDLDAFNLIKKNAYKDYRRALMIFQPAIQTIDGNKVVRADRLIEVFNFIKEDSIEEIMLQILENNVDGAIESVESYTASGVPADIIIQHLYTHCRNMELIEGRKGVKLLKVFSDVSGIIFESAIPNVVLSYLIVAMADIINGD